MPESARSSASSDWDLMARVEMSSAIRAWRAALVVGWFIGVHSRSGRVVRHDGFFESPSGGRRLGAAGAERPSPRAVRGGGRAHKGAASSGLPADDPGQEGLLGVEAVLGLVEDARARA